MVDVSDELTRYGSLFVPYQIEKRAKAAINQDYFVHYTSATSAKLMIENKQVWMRRSNVMNDFMEVEHGLACLQHSWTNGIKDRLEAVMEACHPGLFQEVVDDFNATLPALRADTFITSLSEHPISDDPYGRLSMWRAYGGPNAVALVLNPSLFLSTNDVLGVYSYAVAYQSIEQFHIEFSALVSNMEANKDVIAGMTRELVVFFLGNMLTTFVLCTKHPGFAEEREWRILHTPSVARAERVPLFVRDVGGVVQTVCGIPLVDDVEAGLEGVTPGALISKILIGPCEYPHAMREAFIRLMEEAGSENAHEKVIVSGIPLRR